MRHIKGRIGYFIAFLVFLGIEFYIGNYVHDQFIRPYVGDLLVVIVLYCFIRGLIPKKFPLMPLGIFIFAVLLRY